MRLRSNLTTIKTVGFTKKSFFCTILGLTQSHSRPLGYIEEFVQKIPGAYQSEKPFNITGLDKVHLKCHRINGSIVNICGEPILYSFELDQLPCHKK